MESIVNKARILIIDDEEDILNLLYTVFNKEGLRNILRADNARDGYNKFKNGNPDLILLDIMLPDGDGYDLCKRIRKESSIPILFMSAKTEEVDRVLGFALGGDDYITKPFSPKEVAYRVKAHLRRTLGIGAVNQGTFSIGPFTVDENKAEVRKNDEIIELKPMEYKMFLYMAKHPNHILSKEQICNEVWGEDYIGFDNTIMVHIRKLRKKIEDNPSQPEYIINVKGLGYKLIIKEE